MESLSETEAKSLRKMSTVHLRGRLLANLSLIGVTADTVAEMSRDLLLDNMANLYILLKDRVDDPLSTIDEGEPGVEVVPPVPLDVSGADAATRFEILRMQLQLQREQHQHERERHQHEREMVQLQNEMKEKDLELRRLEAASAEQLKREELNIRRLEITEEVKREQQQVILLKRYSEALKGVLHPQPADPCGLPLYFDNLERLYRQFEVPTKLQASLLIPYLSTSTQMMITRLPAADLENYTKVKEFILAQHKLSSRDYKERFSQAIKNSNETNVSYVSRLSTLQDYWLRSKEVSTFDQLRDLHVLEKLHDTLHPVVLRHVLTVEADKNVTAMRAAEIADIFEGNLPSDSKLRYQIEHFEPYSVRQNRSRPCEGRKHREKTLTEKGYEKMGPYTKADKDDIYQKSDNKAEKRKKDFSKSPHFGKHGVCWLCGESKIANNGCKSPFHKKAVSVNLTTVESPPVSDTGLFENSTPNVCHINVAGYNVRNDIPANKSHESLNTMSVVNSESCSDALRGVLDDSDFTEIIQPAELIDVYHPADDICQSGVFDDLSTLGSVESDLRLSGPDTVVGKDSDFSKKLSKSFDVKPH